MRVKVYVKKATPSKNLLNLQGRKPLIYTYKVPTDKIDLAENIYLPGMASSGYINKVNITFYSIQSGIIMFNANKWYGLGFPVKCNPNTAYTLSVGYSDKTHSAEVAFYTSDGLYISRTQNAPSFTTPENCAWMVVVLSVRMDTTNATICISNVQVEEGSTATEYEPYGNYQRVKVWNGKKSKNLFNLNNRAMSWHTDDTKFEKLTESSFRMFVAYDDLGYYDYRLQVQVGKTYTIAVMTDQARVGSYPSIVLSRKQNAVGNIGALGLPTPNSWYTRKITADTVELHILFYGRPKVLTEFKCMLLEGSYTADNLPDFEPYNQARMKVHVKE